MKKNMRKMWAVLLTVVMLGSILVGCGNNSGEEAPENVQQENPEAADNGTKEEDAGGEVAESGEASKTDTETSGNISMAVTYADSNLDEFKNIISEFEKESGVTVELITPASEYESVLKTMMASNTLPDIFMTHGWSLRRYSEYLQPVNSQPWFGSMDKALEPIMADEDGNVYALCVSTSVSGVYFNGDALKKAGIEEPYSIVTWKDFEDACEKAKAVGLVPIAVGGGSGSGQFSSIFGGIAPTLWTDAGAKYDLADVLLNGSFDSDTYVTEMYEMIAGWLEKGYFNEDCLTLDFDGASRMLGSGDAAFMLRGPLTIAHEAFPDADCGILPELASIDGAKPSFRLGEGNAYGVWKDTANADACWALLEYLARPENVERICALGTDYPAIEGVEAVDAFGYGIYAKAVEAYGDNLQYDNLFDRKYLPSGMWSILGDSLSMVFESPDDVKPAVEVFKEGYIEKYEESKGN
ncbi:extracellular solute-binding protein [Lachnospiraceae bacterium]|nr:extracellular solute-binding protein [Lachnospiraceae bacterium]